DASRSGDHAARTATSAMNRTLSGRGSPASLERDIARSATRAAHPTPSRQNVDRALSGAVDLASGLVSTVAGRGAGQRVHDALSRVAHTVESALDAATRAGLTRDATGQLGTSPPRRVPTDGSSLTGGRAGAGTAV